MRSDKYTFSSIYENFLIQILIVADIFEFFTIVSKFTKMDIVVFMETLIRVTRTTNFKSAVIKYMKITNTKRK
jgi:hypothetical protein